MLVKGEVRPKFGITWKQKVNQSRIALPRPFLWPFGASIFLKLLDWPELLIFRGALNNLTN